jgi:hypothetical protein
LITQKKGLTPILRYVTICYAFCFLKAKKCIKK